MENEGILQMVVIKGGAIFLGLSVENVLSAYPKKTDNIDETRVKRIKGTFSINCLPHCL